jgi:hypothetical protein
MVAGASFAQAPVPVPSYVLFGTIPATSVGTATLACDVPSLISGYVPFAASSSEYYKDAAGVHINFGQPVDYFKKGAGDTNFGGWALLKFNTAKSGTVALDASPWTYDYGNNTWTKWPNFSIAFSEYSASYAANTLTVTFKMTAQGCVLPISATYHNFGQ